MHITVNCSFDCFRSRWIPNFPKTVTGIFSVSYPYNLTTRAVHMERCCRLTMPVQSLDVWGTQSGDIGRGTGCKRILSMLFFLVILSHERHLSVFFARPTQSGNIRFQFVLMYCWNIFWLDWVLQHDRQRGRNFEFASCTHVVTCLLPWRRCSCFHEHSPLPRTLSCDQR